MIIKIIIFEKVTYKETAKNCYEIAILSLLLLSISPLTLSVFYNTKFEFLRRESESY